MTAANEPDKRMIAMRARQATGQLRAPLPTYVGRDVEIVPVLWDVDRVLGLSRAFGASIVILDFDDVAEAVAMARTLRRGNKGLKVVLIGDFATPDEVLEALGQGACAYLSRHRSAPAQLVAALRAVHAGHAVIDLGVAEGIRAPASANPLTAEEQRLLSLLAEGLSYRQIGEHLQMSPATLKRRLSRIGTKLGTNNRLESLALATRRGLF